MNTLLNADCLSNNYSKANTAKKENILKVFNKLFYFCFEQKKNTFFLAMLFIGSVFPITLWANPYGLPDRQCFYNGEAQSVCLSYKVDWSDYRCHSFVEPDTGYGVYNFYWRRLYPHFVDCSKDICKAPYAKEPETGKCIKYCPPSKPDLNLDIGQCVAREDEEPPKECQAGNPIVISTGEKIQIEFPDYQSKGPLPLFFQRDYRSNRAEESDIFWQQERGKIILNMSYINITQWIRYEQPVGYEPQPWVIVPRLWNVIEGSGSEELQPPVAGHKQWRHNYQSKLYETTTRLIIDSPQGYKIFKPESDIYVSTSLGQDNISSVTLVDGNTGWRYYVSPQYSEYYNNQGQLVRLEQSASIYQTLTYNAEEQLESVTHSLGGSLQFAYNSEGQLSQLTTPDNKTIAYTYDSKGNPTHVTTTYADASIRTRQYHYENADLPFALTGITDEKGVRYASWTYNEQGQAIESVHAGGADKTTFDYNGDVSTSVTSALNKTTIYHYDNSGGMKRLSSVEGVATANCAAANQAYSYYDNGLLQSKTDWQGNTTSYTYNDKHQEISRTEASGTPQARTITTQWHDTFNLPVQISEPSRVISYSYNAQGKLLNKTINPINGQGE